MRQRRLYRSSSEKMVFGVCGGLAEYFDVDPTIVRVGFAVAALFNGLGILLYLALAILMPKGPARTNSAGTAEDAPQSAVGPEPPDATPAPEATAEEQSGPHEPPGDQEPGAQRPATSG